MAKAKAKWGAPRWPKTPGLKSRPWKVGDGPGGPCRGSYAQGCRPGRGVGVPERLLPPRGTPPGPDAAGRKVGPPNLQHPHFLLLLLLLLRGLRQVSGGGKGPLGVGDPDRYSGRAAAPAPLENGLRALAPPPRRRRKAPSLSFPKEWAPGAFRSDGHPRLGRRAARGQAGVGVPQGRRLRGRLETVRGRASLHFRRTRARGAGAGVADGGAGGGAQAAAQAEPPEAARGGRGRRAGGAGWVLAPRPPLRRPRDPSWFLGDAASERDQLWSALLRAAGSDPSPAGDPLPPLPAAPGQVGPRGASGARARARGGGAGRPRWGAGPDDLAVSQDPGPGPECEAPPEVFRVGPRAFLWTPLPPAPGAAGGLARSSSLPCAAGRHPGSLSVSSASSPCLHPTPEPPADPSAEELPSGEEPPALESCPMCQAPFGSTMSQLDVDGHLAQCLLKAPRTWHGEVEPMDTACLALISPLICPCVHMAWLSVHHGCCVEMCPLKVPVGHRGRVSYVGSFLTSARGHRSLRLRSDALREPLAQPSRTAETQTGLQLVASTWKLCIYFLFHRLPESIRITFSVVINIPASPSPCWDLRLQTCFLESIISGACTGHLIPSCVPFCLLLHHQPECNRWHRVGDVSWCHRDGDLLPTPSLVVSGIWRERSGGSFSTKAVVVKLCAAPSLGGRGPGVGGGVYTVACAL
ncbi:uncharacterized protein LOC143675675 [Tamandua tetradactyla]|uniref:uncharacterized protein LOC143675675 n=1 Tax=Tamandua tetradactyla TaxID=48850 RepID=UPI0040542F4A